MYVNVSTLLIGAALGAGLGAGSAMLLGAKDRVGAAAAVGAAVGPLFIVVLEALDAATDDDKADVFRAVEEFRSAAQSGDVDEATKAMERLKYALKAFTVAAEADKSKAAAIAGLV